MYRLSHYASDIDEKIKRIPYIGALSSKWFRTDDWQYIADQEFDPESGFAQSGKAIAAALNSVTVDAISDEEIIELFADDDPGVPTGEYGPTAYLYGRFVKEGETLTHTINSVDYANVTPLEDPEEPEAL